MNEPLLLVKIEEDIAMVTINRPDVRNAISLELVDQLDILLDQLEMDPNVKVVIFTGSGDRAFISGGDLDQFLSVRTKDKSKPMLMKVGKVLSKIEKLNKPTIAMINGAAIGGGCEFATACDFRFASDQARMGFVQIGMHITTGWGSGSRLVKKIGRNKALTLLLTGEIIDARQAMQSGFVDNVIEHKNLRHETLRFAQKIAKNPLPGIQAYMKLVKQMDAGMDLETCIEMEIDRCSDMWGSEAHYSVVQSFLTKSKDA